MQGRAPTDPPLHKDEQLSAVEGSTCSARRVVGVASVTGIQLALLDGGPGEGRAVRAVGTHADSERLDLPPTGLRLLDRVIATLPVPPGSTSPATFSDLFFFVTRSARLVALHCDVHSGAHSGSLSVSSALVMRVMPPAIPAAASIAWMSWLLLCWAEWLDSTRIWVPSGDHDGWL